MKGEDARAPRERVLSVRDARTAARIARRHLARAAFLLTGGIERYRSGRS
jgi:hypothetical protein